MKKISIFLGGYINYTNAQNLNCRAIADHLNKEKFDVFTLKAHFGDNTSFKIDTFTCKIPFRFTRHLGFLWGILNCDVAYFPKHVDTPLWILKLSKLLKKPIFTTIEGNVTDLSKSNLISFFGTTKIMKNHFSYFKQVFGISHFLIQETQSVISMSDTPLLLGVNVHQFDSKIAKKLRSIVFVGGLIKRKRVDEFLQLAKFYPQINFNIIGNGSEKNNLEKNSSSNVIFHGVLSHTKMNAIFQQSDLMFLPAISEGFPKVILEAASAGISSIVYNTYGASNWMNDRENGFIVNDFNEVKSVVNELLNDSILLQNTSEGAVKLSQKFDWRNIILDWEKVIADLQNGK
jgi:glycosyltransferase involved in cell wall biosynthesis